MFLVNSRFPLASATPSSSGREVLHPNGVLLLPKLRRHFAEFLSHRSPDRLGILYLPTCVGLGYGHCASSLGAFLGSIGSVTSPKRLGIASQRYRRQLSSPAAYTLTPGLPTPGFTYLPASLFGYPQPVCRFVPKDSPLVPGIGLGADTVVPEYQPVVHRLRLSASP